MARAKKEVKKEKKVKTDGKVRLPRVFGLTQMMVQVSKLEDAQRAELITKAQDYIIQQWMLSNGTVCGVNYSVFALANFIKCEPDRIQVFMRDRMLSTKIWDADKQQDILNGILGQQLAWVLEDRMETQGQLEILKESQGGRYAPFISGEVNKAIKLKMEAGTALQSVVRNLSGGSTVNIFNQFNQQNNLENGDKKGVTQNEAMNIINEQYDLLALEKNSKNFLEEHYDLSELPVVVASEQTGIDTDKEGLKIMSREMKVIVDNYKENLTGGSSDIDFHEIRREVELGIDEEDEDEEFVDYEED